MLLGCVHSVQMNERGHRMQMDNSSGLSIHYLPATTVAGGNKCLTAGV